jgi:hypothetical protein
MKSAGAQEPRATGSADRDAGAWTSVERGASSLGVGVVRGRRSLERNARRTEDGQIVARVDGIVARKLGRTWRVWLDTGWRSPLGTR